jgi:hypothetical protein
MQRIGGSASFDCRSGEIPQRAILRVFKTLSSKDRTSKMIGTTCAAISKNRGSNLFAPVPTVNPTIKKYTGNW